MTEKMTDNINLKTNNVESGAADNSAALDQNGKINKTNAGGANKNGATNKPANNSAASKVAAKPANNSAANSVNKPAAKVTAKGANQNADKPSALKSDYPSGAPKNGGGKNDGEKSKKGVVISYSINTTVALALGVLVAYYEGLFGGLSGKALFSCLSNSFFVPGVLLSGFGALLKIAEGGFFDGIGYGLKRAVLSFIPGARIKKEENYAEYKERKEKNRRHASLAATLVVGLAFIAIAAIFLIFYNNVAAAEESAALCFLCR